MKYQLMTAKGQPNGFAGLDSNGLVPSAQLPQTGGEVGGVSPIEVTFIAPTAALALTNQANAEQFLGNGTLFLRKADLTSYTQVRLLARVTTVSGSVNSPRVYLEYHTAFSTTVSDYSAIGASAVNCPLTALGIIDSGWINLVAGAKADRFLAVLQNGGNAAADPALSWVAAQFK